ncbi:phosphotransacetylase family protein [Geomonas sp.]|uniref:phosphotransacetylase family protein n=1 Tax=Geomonas sp. TaxID=2651584 RepID=UPI002B4682EF|nr:AAA family ATPase [Geomonas sp.]HJV35550.1 AAA family ATPase [Geomonas sp.]
MAKRIFVAATGQNVGKTTTSLSLLHLAQKKYRRIGFMKPMGPKPGMYNGRWFDKDAVLVARVFGLQKQLPCMSPVLVHPDTTRMVVDGQIPLDELPGRIVRCYEELEKQCDFIIIEGSGHPGVGSIMKLSNARIAKLLNAPVVMVTGGGLGNVVDNIHMNLALFRQEQADVKAVLVNKILAEKRDTTIDYLTRAFADEPFTVLPGFTYQPILANPTLRRISSLLDLPLHGSRRDVGRIIHNVQIGAASTQRVTELLKDSSLLIVTSSRDELLVTLANLYQMKEYREKIVGLIIPGIAPISTITQRILDCSRIPYLRTFKHTTTALHQIITEDVSKLTAEDTEKLDLIRSLAENSIDFDTLDKLAC